MLFAGVRVLDLSRMLAGPYGSMLLADLGAEVIKIEEPGGGDPMRAMGPPFLDGESAYFLAINRNKKSVVLDLERPEGREVFLDLCRVADVVWENFRPGVMARLGCEPATLRGLNPRLIVCSISAFGQSGPYRDWPAFDLALQAMGGAMSITGEEGRPPVRMGLPMGDLAGGMFGALAVAGALFRRAQTGEGTTIDLSLLDCQVSLLTYVAQYYWTDGRVPGRVGSGHASVVPYQAFATQDGFLVVAVFAEKFWTSFCRAIDRSDLVADPRFDSNPKRVERKAELIPLLEAIFLARATSEWLARLQREGVPAAPIQRVDQVLSDPQVLLREMVVDLEHPKVGTVKTLGTPIKPAGAPPFHPAPPPALGEHTDAILGGLLGYPPARLEALRQRAAIG
ncbi:MAG TPA: CoA transferase [Methylomirabilota bacterium]|jgi:formyl-CoA transferase/CoA:oxalate CoA-transferase|nr:CoA transferase [Methylomirabilota bacterium]